MKQVINRRGSIVVEDVPPPACGPGDVLIALTHSLISSGTELKSVAIAGQGLTTRARERPDLVKKVIGRAREQGISAAYRAVRDKLDEPKPLGYSAAGVVLETGREITRFSPGDRVACGGADACHSSIVSVGENLVVRIPQGVSSAHAAFATVGSIAVQGVRRVAPEFGEVAVVMGLGLIGQICVQVAKAAGLQVIGFDLDSVRVALARQLGADAAHVLGDPDPVEAVAQFTGGAGADLAIVAAATEASDPINQAMHLLRERGRISIVGVTGLNLARGSFYNKELDVFMSRSYGPGRYDRDYEVRGLDYPIGFVRWTENRNMAEVLRLIHDERLRVEPLISRMYRIDDAPAAYAALKDPESKPLGVLLEYGECAPAKTEPRVPARPARGTRKQATVAVVGCGNFARLERLPYLRSMPKFRIGMLVGHTGAKVNQLAEQFGGAPCSTDYQDALKDPAIDLVLIATPHRLHAQIIVDAAAAGKDMLVEKPMAVNPDELDEVYRAVSESGVRFSVGFNRRFAPASTRLQEWLKDRREPVSIVYRANVGLVPPDTPMHAPEEGGGRIVGEACHFFDYCAWLAGAPAISVAASTVSYSGDRFSGGDNLSSIVKFADGSTATIVYCTMGHGGLSKERIEVFCGGVAALVDDFKALAVHGRRTGAWEGRQDKGHRGYMAAVAEAMTTGAPLPIGLDESHASHRLTFAAMEAARTGRVITLNDKG